MKREVDAKVLVYCKYTLGITSSPIVDLVLYWNVDMKVAGSILGGGEISPLIQLVDGAGLMSRYRRGQNPEGAF